VSWSWTRREITDDGQRVEIARLGPRRWRLRNLTPIIAPEDHHPDEVEVTTRREAIRLAEERWAVHPRRWEDAD
jgi:hypothetical protein